MSGGPFSGCCWRFLGTKGPFFRTLKRVFPKIVGFAPKSSILIGFSIVFTIHCGGTPFFWKPRYRSGIVYHHQSPPYPLRDPSSTGRWTSAHHRDDPVNRYVCSCGEFLGGTNQKNNTKTRTNLHIGVSKNSGTAKWMVKIMENPIKNDFRKHPYTHCVNWYFYHIASIVVHVCFPFLLDVGGMWAWTSRILRGSKFEAKRSI